MMGRCSVRTRAMSCWSEIGGKYLGAQKVRCSWKGRALLVKLSIALWMLLLKLPRLHGSWVDEGTGSALEGSVGV